MRDTTPEMERLYRRLLLARSGEERMKMGLRMFDTARALVRAGLGDGDGSDRSPGMRVALFLRTYGQDFDDEARARIVAALHR